MADTTYRDAACAKAMQVLKRARKDGERAPLNRSQINERCGAIAEAGERSHKPAGEVNDAEYAGRIIGGWFFTRPSRGFYSCQEAPEGADAAACALLAAEIRAASKAPAEAPAEDASEQPAEDGEQPAS